MTPPSLRPTYLLGLDLTLDEILLSPIVAVRIAVARELTVFGTIVTEV